MSAVRIKGEPADSLSLTVHRRTRSATGEYWDDNWLDCTADVVAGKFHGTVTGRIRADELRRFRDDVARLYDRLQGQVVFETMEQWIRVEISGDGRGHFAARCMVCDDLAGGNTLDFRLHFDQTYLPGIIRELDAVLAEFPVLGHP